MRKLLLVIDMQNDFINGALGTPVRVIADCCAGVTPQSHRAALDTMRMCQIEVL